MEVEFIIPTYNRPNGLLTVIGSILQQSNPNWRIHVVADGEYDGYERVKNFFAGNDKIKFTEIDGPNNDFGHTAREHGLQSSNSEWVVMTGDDNYYVPAFVGLFISAAQAVSEANFIFCDLLHNADISHTPSYNYFNSRIELTYIDIGNFATRSELAKNIKIRKEYYEADFIFASEYARKYCQSQNSIVKINKALYVHN